MKEGWKGIRLGAVILAAGYSRRMGRPKMLLPWRQTTVLGHHVALWNRLPVAQLVVVLPDPDPGVGLELDRLGFPASQRVVNPEPDRGMFSSIQCAARWYGWQRALTHWVLVLGDQPQLKESTFQSLLQEVVIHPNSIVQPSQQGRPRHPVVLPKVAWSELAASTDPHLKAFLSRQADRCHGVELVDALEFDLDDPKDYEEAIRRFGGV